MNVIEKNKGGTIILTTMGIIAGERKSGVAAMILVKPVSFQAFVTSKWAGSLLLVWLSLLIGYISTWYYTGILFDWIPIVEFFQSYFFFGIWLTVIVTITVFFSASLLAPGMAGFISLSLVLVSDIVSASLSHWLEWSPAQLTNYANIMLITGEIPDHTWGAGIIALAIIITLLSFSIFILKKKELAA